MNPTYTGSFAIYLRLVDYGSKVLTSNGSAAASITPITGPLDVNNPQFIKVISYSSSIEQTLNIGSQSSGGAAGKIAFNPLVISKYMDAASPLLFQSAATGTPYKTAEVFFINPQNAIIFKHTYKMVAVKTVSWSADGDAGILENISFEYGGQLITVMKQSPDGKLASNTQAGWNRLKNVADNDLDSIIGTKI